jgi:hypothetical protein
MGVEDLMSSAASEPLATEVMKSAFGVALNAGCSHVGVGHLLAALLSHRSTAASRILGDLGLSREGIAELFEFGTRTARSGGVSVTPGVYGILGVARGIALAQGTPDASASQLLLAMVYSDSGILSSSLERFGVDQADVIARLAREGVSVPVSPSVTRRLDPVNGVIFPAGDLKRVLDAMLRAFPPGSGVRWGWNKLDDHRCIIYTSEVAGTRSIVAANVANPEAVVLLQ